MTDPPKRTDPPCGEPAWREADSATFIDHGAVFTPEREHQHEIIATLIGAIGPGARVVELCCGAGDLAAVVLDHVPDCHVLALDGSPAMLAAARRTCARHGDRLELRRFDLAADDWRNLEPAPDAVYTSLAVHHLEGDGKRRLFGDLCRALRPGGILVLADLMRPTTAAGWRIAAEAWDREVARRSAQIHGDDRAWQRFRELRWNYFRFPDDNGIDHPSSLADQVEGLGAAGFERADVHWMRAGHAIISAQKPGPSQRAAA